MGESTTSADLIRKDIKELRNKYLKFSLTNLPPFFVFFKDLVLSILIKYAKYALIQS